MNYCDYDNLLTYPTGSFSSKHKTQISDCLVEVDKDSSFNKEIVNSFLNSEYRTYKAIKTIILYRLFGSFKNDVTDKDEKPRGAKINGIYTSTEFAESIIDAKIRLALDPSWKNPKVYEIKILVPKGTQISVGYVAPIKLKSETTLEGQAEQVLLPRDWPTSWIVGFRRVTSRQLQKIPEYSSVKTDDDILKRISCVNKKDLYSKVCPICGCEDVVALSNEKQFDIVGCKGNIYKMKYHCNNDKCKYYW